MSFKVSDILNPVPTPPPLSPPKPSTSSFTSYSSATTQPHASQSHTAQLHTVQSPDSYSATQHEGSRHGSHSSNYPPAVSSSYEAASALTTLATNAATSYHSFSPTQSSCDHFSPVATSFPPLYDSTRRQSIYTPLEPSPITERIPTQTSPATTLEQYHHTPSRSPEQQFLSRFSPGPVLAPLGEHARTTPPQQGANAYTPEDNSRILHHPDPTQQQQQHHRTMDDTTNAEANEIARNRESEYVRETPVTDQIREASATAPVAQMEPSAPEPAERKPIAQSPPHIKDEPSGTPRESTPAQPVATPEIGEATTITTTTTTTTITKTGNLDTDTIKAIEAAKNDFSFRDRSRPKPSIEVPPTDSAAAIIPTPTSADPASKKRPAPSRNRKGMASTVKKPAAKKRKVEGEASATPGNVRRSATPSSRTSKTPGITGSRPGKKSQSGTPAFGSSPAPDFIDDGDEEPGSEDSSGEVFCICRRGDNHTYMIACDGGCEDWFHGKCVHIREEDGDLIDKYICPTCSEKSGSVTTWLPMCRREGCRKPARLRKGSASKYCSDECGRLFMQAMVNKSAGGAGTAGSSPQNTKARRRKGNATDHTGNEGDSDDDDLGPRGGALRPSELKALVVGAKDITTFRALGEGVLSPPATASPTAGTFPVSAKLPSGTNGDSTTDEKHTSYTLTPSENLTIKNIAEEKDKLRTHRALLRDKERFVGMTREQVQRFAEREGIKPKDVCGYDARLSWTDEQFEKFFKSEKGVTALRTGTLELPETETNTPNGVEPKSKEESLPTNRATAADKDENKDAMDIDADVEKEYQMCTRKRCERHRLWQKQALGDVRFEESALVDQMRRLEREEREVREGAMLRWRKEVSAGDGGAREGWVEVVDKMEVEA